MPVIDLLRERAGASGRLLFAGVASGWLIAVVLALVLSAGRAAHVHLSIAACTALLLAIPVGVLATACLSWNRGGPKFVLALVIGARDFRLLHQLLRSARKAPHLLHARAQGFTARQAVRVHLLPTLTREILALGVMSLTLGLSALVPVEVLFDVPGLGQLAWSAAMNRDLPVLVAVTALLATCVGLAGVVAQPETSKESVECATQAFSYS